MASQDDALRGAARAPRGDVPAEVGAGEAGSAAAGLHPEAGALFDASAIASILTDGAPDHRILRANAAFLALTGRPASGILGESLRTLRSPADRIGWARWAEGTNDGTGEGTGETGGEAPSPVGGAAELLCARADGTAFWGALTLAPVAGTGFALGQVVDVTRCREAEGALALSRQREALGLLTNSVAHEFNNFLQILIGYIDGLKRRLGDRQEPFIQRAVTRSTEAAERAAILTRQLLAHSRRIAPDVRALDLDAVVARFADGARPSLPERLTLAVVTTPDLPPALANATQVELALGHILANSCEAIAGEGRIEIATFAVARGDRTLARPEDGAVGIAVSDTGHGISPELMTRALAPFATSRDAGRGVGLAIVHGLMKRQSGTVALESRPGEGTTVRLVFPAAG